MVHKMQFSEDLGFIIDPVITYTLASLCELVNVCLTEAQANSLCYKRSQETNGFLCYKCKLIFGFYYNMGWQRELEISSRKHIDLLQSIQRQA